MNRVLFSLSTCVLLLALAACKPPAGDVEPAAAAQPPQPEITLDPQAEGDPSHAEDAGKPEVPSLKVTTVDGTEALIEGFGSLSGRASRSF